MTGGESLPEADREALAKAQAKRERKAKNKHEKQREEQAAKMKVLTMKQNSIHPRNIVAGTLGYVDLSSSSGDLIVQFGMIGGDRIATIESLGDSHMLKLAGIKVGDSILANFIRFGICLADRTRLNMGTEEYRKKSIVAEHIREQMEQRGVRLLKPAASV